MKTIVVIGDVQESRKIGNRSALQAELQAVLNRLNRRGLGLLSPYTITLGDEFQAVYGDAHRLFNDFWEILLGIHPTGVRFSIGVDELSTPLNPKQAIGMDGPAFHLAREGIVRLKKSKSIFRVAPVEPPLLPLVNHGLELISKMARNWSRNRMEILLSLMRGEKPEQAAKKLSISTVAVYKNINVGALDTIINIQTEVCRLVAEAVEGR